MNAVIYARFSPGKNQKEISIEGQLRECHNFADRNNYTIVGEYIDRRLTGRNDNRADFQRLMTDCEKRCFDVVIVWKFDRFFRNRSESAIYRKHLASFGVKLISAKEFIPDGSGGIIMAGMIETVAEWYSAQLSENVTRGLYETAKRCQATGPVALGFRIGSDKRLHIDPVAADAVRTIFQMYDEGAGKKEIVDALNADGYLTKMGGQFKISTLAPILQNEKYIGVYRWHDEIEIPDGCPRIVSDELFFSVQRKLAKTKRPTGGAGRAKIEYFLSTKVFCGHCGTPMCGVSGNGRGGNYGYYSCGERIRTKKCKKKNERKEYIEQLVFDRTLAMLTDANIAYISKEVERIAADESQNKAILAQLNGELAAVTARLKNIGNAIAAGIITETTKELLDTAEEERAALNKRITQEKITAKLSVRAESVACWLHTFKNHDPSDIEFKRQLFAALVHSVYVYDDRLKIIFNVDSDRDVEVCFADVESVESGCNMGLYTVQPAQPKDIVFRQGKLCLFLYNDV